MRIFEPGWMLVVEIGESTVLYLFGIDARRIEPGISLPNEFARGVGNGLDAWIGVFGRLSSGRPRKREAVKG
jgi:hypothetical protein